MNRENTDIEYSRNAESAVHSRRTMLRGLLAAGCSLLIPAALQGCDNRKESASAGSEGGPPMADPATSGLQAAQPAKVSKASVQYQTQPKGEQQCSNCQYFIAESKTCKKVEGDISPTGWCLIWSSGDLSRRDRRSAKPATQLA